jgi:hypothetical protein
MDINYVLTVESRRYATESSKNATDDSTPRSVRHIMGTEFDNMEATRREWTASVGGCKGLFLQSISWFSCPNPAHSSFGSTLPKQARQSRQLANTHRLITCRPGVQRGRWRTKRRHETSRKGGHPSSSIDPMRYTTATPEWRTPESSLLLDLLIRQADESKGEGFLREEL